MGVQENNRQMHANGWTPEHDAAQEVKTIDLVELMYLYLERWKLIALAAVLGAVIAAVYTFRFVTPLYQATSTIYVVSRNNSVISVSDLQLGSAIANDYIKVFQMWELHEEVIDNLDLPYTHAQTRRMLSVTNAASTRMLDLTVTSSSPTEAARMANEYARVGSQYIADSMSTEKPNVMSVALVPANPVSPNKTRNIVLGFLLGGAAMAGVILLQYVLDDKYKTAEDIRKYTGLSTLAVVPVEDSGEQDGGASRKNNKKSARGKSQ